jgi:hypothetical protein
LAIYLAKTKSKLKKLFSRAGKMWYFCFEGWIAGSANRIRGMRGFEGGKKAGKIYIYKGRKAECEK